MPPVRVLLILVFVGSQIVSVRADVVVVANRTSRRFDLTFRSDAGPASVERLDRQSVRPFPIRGRLSVAVPTAARWQPAIYSLQANRCYYLGETRADGVRLVEIALPVGGDTKINRSWSRGRAPAGAEIIPLKVLVDDNEPAQRRVWEPRLRRRVEVVSELLRRHCGIGLRVVAVGTWTTDNRVDDFGATLRQFEQAVRPAPARLAIGFTSQYKITVGRTHLGGTRGPLHSHILLREWSQRIPEKQRVELLLHELGHHLGAVHSPERDSVMRPVLIGKKNRRSSFPVHFDPVNTLAMNLVGEEIRFRRTRSFSALDRGTRALLRGIYLSISEALPDDPAAPHYLEQLAATRPLTAPSMRPSGKQRRKNPLLADTRDLIDRLIEVASRRASQSRGTEESSEVMTDGDRLMETYVRTVAEAAKRLSPKEGATAFLLALGIALDDSSVLRLHPRTRDFVGRLENLDQRRDRIAAVGTPTMRGRRDLAKDFVVSSYLAAIVGRRAAETAGLAKELADAQTGSGLSFADLTANLAGIEFAGEVLRGTLSLDELARDFTVAEWLPDVSSLPEGLDWNTLQANYDVGPDNAGALLTVVRRHLAEHASKRGSPPSDAAP
ncbi:MAG: M12 family metallo-peptidase [Pirellulales bacterium]